MKLPLDVHTRLGGFRLDVACSVPARGITAVFGRSGAGKTTLLRALAGLEGGANSSPETASIGFVFQEPRLFPHLDVRGNIAFRRTRGAQRKEALRELLAWLDLEQLADRTPAGLSGGEQARVSIARALYGDPDLLLMDEPLAALDHAARESILERLDGSALMRGRPVFYVTHSLAEAARLGQTLLLLEGGRLVAVGPMNDLLTSLDSGLATRPDACALLEGPVVARDTEYGLVTVATSFGNLEAPSRGAGNRARVLVRARDVSLALEDDEAGSIRNRFAAQVVATQDIDRTFTAVLLDATGTKLLAHITRRSAQALPIESGRKVFARVKGVALTAYLAEAG